MGTATPRRRSFNLRIQGNDSDLPAVERIHPHPRNSLPKWAVLLSRSKAGFYNLVFGASKQVVFSVGLRSRCWAFPLVQISPRKFAYDWSTRMCELLQPIGKCLMDLGLDLAACQPSVQRLEVTRSRSESQVVIYIRHAYLVDAANVPERGAHGDSETDCLEAEDSEVASCSSDVESTQDGVDAECVSDISDVPDCGVEAEDEAEDDLARGVFSCYTRASMRRCPAFLAETSNTSLFVFGPGGVGNWVLFGTVRHFQKMCVEVTKRSSCFA